MKVSVIVPVYNEEAHIAACLEHILDQEIKADEVIVVDNNCVDNTIKIVKKYPGVKVVKQKVQGMIPARNKGFDSATGTVVARTDADTLVPRDWIKKIKETFKDKEVVAFSGPARFYDVPELLQVSKIPMHVYFHTFKRLFHHECLFGPNMAIRRTMWHRLRKEVCLDDDIVHEDIDLALHSAKYGKIVFDYSHVVLSSPRRWKKLKPYYEYPFRYFKTLKQHHESLLAYKKSKGLAMRIIPKTKRLINALTYSSFNL